MIRIRTHWRVSQNIEESTSSHRKSLSVLEDLNIRFRLQLSRSPERLDDFMEDVDLVRDIRTWNGDSATLDRVMKRERNGFLLLRLNLKQIEEALSQTFLDGGPLLGQSKCLLWSDVVCRDGGLGKRERLTQPDGEEDFVRIKATRDGAASEGRQVTHRTSNEFVPSLDNGFVSFGEKTDFDSGIGCGSRFEVWKSCFDDFF